MVFRGEWGPESGIQTGAPSTQTFADRRVNNQIMNLFK